MKHLIPHRQMNYITGRFEFLHKTNLAWLLKAEKIGAPVTLRLLPGEDNWILPDFKSRSELLKPFEFVQTIVPVQSETPDPPDTISKPDDRQTQRLLLDFFHRYLSKTVFFDVSDFLFFREKNPAIFQNKIIVSTNGCFDILHPGHLKILTEARRLGDMLIVAINADESVKRFKGPDRPIHNALFRSSLLARLPFVDFVIIFNEDTVISVLEKLQPKKHVKGGSFLEDRIRSEKECLQRWGGDLILLPMEGDFSTTSILRRYPGPPFPD